MSWHLGFEAFEDRNSQPIDTFFPPYEFADSVLSLPSSRYGATIDGSDHEEQVFRYNFFLEQMGKNGITEDDLMFLIKAIPDDCNLPFYKACDCLNTFKKYHEAFKRGNHSESILYVYELSKVIKEPVFLNGRFVEKYDDSLMTEFEKYSEIELAEYNNTSQIYERGRTVQYRIHKPQVLQSPTVDKYAFYKNDFRELTDFLNKHCQLNSWIRVGYHDV